ncbi:MAG: hypothetical protein IJW29_07525 [Clostridia bacterium]|nr:hypothetical protein [Clostridia bacterium]
MKHTYLTRVAACLLCLCALFALPSCSGEGSEVPEGMKYATAEGADFRLYVPSSWNVNTAYGVSGAYYNALEQSTVSVVKYPITADMELAMAASDKVDEERPSTRMQWYFEEEVYTALSSVADEGTLTAHTDDFADTTLDGVNAKRYHHSLEVKEIELHFLHVVAERNDAFYVFSFTATEKYYTDLYTANGSDVKKILKEFKFADTGYKPEDPAKELEDEGGAPDGMKLASTKEVAYLFYVPTAWKINVTNEIYSASVDGAVVSVTPYQPSTTNISVKTYAEDCEKLLKDASENYEALVRFEEGKLGGGNALIWEYRYTLGGTTYRGRQVMVGYGGMIYSVTYTAQDSAYDANLQDAMRIFEEFTFRRS